MYVGRTRQQTVPLAVAVCFFVLLLLLHCTTFAAVAQPQTTEELRPVTLQLRWFHQFQFAGYYAAKAKGYYEEAGLDVSIKARDNNQDPIEEVLQGRAQFGVTNSEVLVHALDGKPLNVLAAIFQHSPLSLLVRWQSPYTTPHDLIGKRVKMSLASRDVELQAMFLNEGVSLDQLELTDGEAGQKDYLDPSLDALAAYITNQPYYLQQLGIPYRLIHPRRYGIDFYGDCLFTSTEMIEDDHDTVFAFREATLRGWQYAMDNPGEIIDLIINEYGVTKPRSHLQFEAEQLEILILPDLVQIGHMNPGRWKHIAATFERLGIVKQGIATDEFLENFIHTPDDHSDIRSLKYAISILAAVLLVLLVVMITQYLITRKLKREIQRREKAEEALRQSEAYHRILFESTGAATLVVRSDHVITLANKQSEALFKMKKHEIEGCKWDDFIASHDLPRAHQFNDDWYAGETSDTEIELDFRDREGGIRRVQVSLGMLKNSASSICSVTDLTPRIEAEQQREEIIEELEVKNEELERFAYTVSHDLKSPLITINGFLGILKEAIEERDHDLVKESIRRITSASSTMLKLLDELLELSRIGRIGDAPVQASLTDLARQAAEQAQGVLDDVGATITIANDLPVVLCDRTRIQEVFRNFYENAARYGATEGQTHIQVGCRVDKTDTGLQSVITVKDNGMGIDPRYSERIFNLFEQLSPGRGGTGIGLSLVKRIIEHHGGKVWVESEGLGHGSTFCFTMGTPKQNR